MSYELTDHEWTAIRPMLPNKPRGVPRERPPCPERHLLGLAIWSAVARSPAELRPLHHLLQSLPSTP
jgi:transposase